jgi:PadR family transcriptional regulator, regulatory protein PadR
MSKPLREPTFLILVALAEEPSHGYGIMKRVGELSDGEVRLGAGTLYGALDRMSEEGWLVLDREEIEAGRLRRYYRLTGTGAGVLAAEARRREALARTARTAVARLSPARRPA